MPVEAPNARTPILSKIGAVGVLVAAIVLRLFLDPYLGDDLPFVTLFGAVAAAVWIAGSRTAVAIACAGYVANHFLFQVPRGRFHFDDTEVVVALVVFGVTCGVVIGIGHAMRAARWRADAWRDLMRVTLASIAEGVITTDSLARITYLNAVGEALTGFSLARARGLPLDVAFRTIHGTTGLPIDDLAVKALNERAVVHAPAATLLVCRDGVERSIEATAAPIKNDAGCMSGCVLVFREAQA